jgi:SAM-dependent methyltransferase
MDERIKEIKKFWDSRATEFGPQCEATLREKYLRLLEIKIMKRLIRYYRPSKVLDVGCGNGFSTKIYALAFPSTKFFGMDYSEEMINHARNIASPNCSFFVGDVLDPESLEKGPYDLIMTQRCLQNLPDYDLQKQAIGNLLAIKNSTGPLLLMECSKDGVKQLNGYRTRLRMKPLENIEPWHNNFLIDKLLKTDFGANITYFSSTYMFLSKILHPRLSSLGYLLPSIGKFGYDRLYIIK